MAVSTGTGKGKDASAGSANGTGGVSNAGIGRILMFEVRKYKEDDFIIPAQDTKGHSERIFYRLQPGAMRDLKVILASKKFPFRTVGDIGRLGTKLVIELLNKMEAMPSVSGQVDTIIKIVRDEEFHQEFIATFEEIGKAVNRYIGGGEERRARKLLIEIRDQINQMPKGYWKEKYQKEIQAKYGHVLAGGTQITGEAEEEEDE